MDIFGNDTMKIIEVTVGGEVVVMIKEISPKWYKFLKWLEDFEVKEASDDS